MPTRPIAKICPSCGSVEYAACKPESFVAFTNDRKCKQCETRYRLPTPAWAAIVFLVLGLLMFVGGAVTFGILVSHPQPHVIGMAINACVAAVGVLTIRHGARALFRPGQV